MIVLQNTSNINEDVCITHGRDVRLISVKYVRRLKFRKDYLLTQPGVRNA